MIQMFRQWPPPGKPIGTSQWDRRGPVAEKSDKKQDVDNKTYSNVKIVNSLILIFVLGLSLGLN